MAGAERSVDALNPPPSRLELGPDEVHVWIVERDGAVGLPPPSVLSAVERARADAFRRPEDQARYRFAHAALRGILARYTGVDPAALAMSRACRHCGAEDHGKPRLVSPEEATALQFNLSHAGDVAAVAVACNREIGVDVERVDAAFDWRPVSAQFFSAAEREAVDAAPPEARARAFFAVWTRKEALLKLSGHGLASSLASTDVSASLGSFGGRVGDAWLHGLDLRNGYMGAVAAADTRPEVRRLLWGGQT